MTLMRHEDLRLITGTGKFTADWNLQNQCYAVFVRSPHAHARVTGINCEAAAATAKVLLVLTAADVTAARMQSVPSGPEIKGIDGAIIKKGTMPVLAIDRVRFVGQPVAVVIAETAGAAQDASELVEVQYEPLPAVASVEDALQSDAPQLHPGVPGNESLRFESGDLEAVDKAFSQSERTATLRIDSQRLYGAPLEPKAITVAHDAGRGITVVHTPTQGVLGMKAGLSSISGIPVEEFEIVSEDVGGSFGLRGGASAEHALLVLAARQLQRPVKWVATRSELFAGEWHGRGLTLEGSIAIDHDDKIAAIKFHDTVDLGAYNCFFGGFIGTNNLSVTMGGAYQVPALYMQSRLVLTNTAPVSAYRGAGRPDIAFGIERLIDHAATTFKLDPVEFRRKNFVPQNAFPYTTANGTVYDCGDFHSVLDKALSQAGYDTFEQRRAAAKQDGKIRGIGIGYYVEKSGAGGAPKDQVSCEFSADGTLTLHAVTGPSGQGHETAFAQIMGDGLGIDPLQIIYRAGSADQSLVGNGTGGSRSLYGTGSAFKNLIDEIINRALPHAARVLNANAEDITFSDGQFMVRNGAGGISLFALSKRLSEPQQHPGSQEHPLNCTAETVTGANYPNGCHIAEVEIDPETGVTDIIAYNAVDDLGNVISPELVRGQVHGGVVQGAGQAFSEAIVYDDNGQLLTGSFMDYAMPRAGTLLNVETDTFAVPTELNELGSKGVGESGCSGSLPCISNAVMNAFASVGAGPLSMPYTPARVWKHLQKHQ